MDALLGGIFLCRLQERRPSALGLRERFSLHHISQLRGRHRDPLTDREFVAAVWFWQNALTYGLDPDEYPDQFACCRLEQPSRRIAPPAERRRFRRARGWRS